MSLRPKKVSEVKREQEALKEKNEKEEEQDKL